MSDFKPYLQSAHIEGYKSIVSCDVTFKPGLNIIIGKNGTGKTNLLEAVVLGTEAIITDFNVDQEFNEKLHFVDEINPRWEIEVTIENVKELEKSVSPGFLDRRALLGGHKIIHLVSENGIAREVGINEEYFVSSDYFQHKIPTSIPFLTDFDFGWKVQNHSANTINTAPLSTVFHYQYYQVWMALKRSKEALTGDAVEINNCIIESLTYFAEAIIPAIRATTPILNIRVREGRITTGTISGSLEAKGYFYEFETNNGFHPFDNLSDGTKRVLLLVSNISGLLSYPRSVNSVAFSLLEEPELGIHPHQLQLLMNFLKEQSKEKQIILTTHSPEVLNILDENEFDRIIIAEFDPNNGSTFRHLTDAEIDKAQQYVEAGLQISDYWKFSDLEPIASR